MSTNSRVFVFVGTRKGGVIYESDKERKDWKMHELQFPGWGVHHMIYDHRSSYLYAALDHAVYGSNVHRSADLGQSWEMSEGPQFPEEELEEQTVKRIWHIHPGHPSEKDVVWAGADPGSLFKSTDGGKTWAGLEGLNNHPTRKYWFPGAGGMMVHTIIQGPTNPERLFVAISAAGVFRSDDGGQSWRPKNKGVRADFMVNKYPEYGQCCHHLVMSPEDPQVLYQQNHCGVYRTTDGGESWEDIGTDRLPSTFGFPMAMHPRQGGTIYVVPQKSDEFRYTPEGKFRVYRSRNGGDSWEALTNGLPQQDAYLGVHREASATDACDPAGVYFGTNTGTLYYSRDEGDSWETLSDTLPPIYSLSTAVIDV